MKNIPVYQPFLANEEKENVAEALDTTWISSKGSFIDEFEKKFAEYIGVKHASTCSNGTTALHLALLALGIKEGDEVIVPTLTYIASVNAIKYVGAQPIFVDSEEEYWQIDPECLRKRITKNTKAIMVVHLYGQSSNLDEIKKIAKEYGLYIIEDCAEAIGTEYKGRKVGSFGDISTFSFYGNKTITTGEGGMVVTDNMLLIERVNHFKGQGLAKYRQYWHDEIGYNYRMTNISAAIGVAQLNRVEEVIKLKQKVKTNYQKYLNSSFVTIHKEAIDTFHSYWMVSILLNENSNKSRDDLASHLRENGVDTRPLFYPVHTMPMYSDNFGLFPIAEKLARSGLNLPSFPQLKEEDIKYISNLINSFLEE